MMSIAYDRVPSALRLDSQQPDGKLGAGPETGSHSSALSEVRCSVFCSVLSQPRSQSIAQQHGFNTRSSAPNIDHLQRSNLVHQASEGKDQAFLSVCRPCFSKPMQARSHVCSTPCARLRCSPMSRTPVPTLIRWSVSLRGRTPSMAPLPSSRDEYELSNTASLIW